MDYWFKLIYEDRIINLRYVKEFRLQGREINIIFEDGRLDSHEFASEYDSKHWFSIIHERLGIINYEIDNGGNT